MSAWLLTGCRQDDQRRSHGWNDHQTKEITMSTPIDYTKLAASLDYAALEKKLAQLGEGQPPKKSAASTAPSPFTLR